MNGLSDPPKERPEDNGELSIVDNFLSGRQGYPLAISRKNSLKNKQISFGPIKCTNMQRFRLRGALRAAIVLVGVVEHIPCNKCGRLVSKMNKKTQNGRIDASCSK